MLRISPSSLRRLLSCCALLCAVSTVPLPPALSAQEVADRAALERLRDSLAGASDSVAVHRLETATIEVAKRNRDDPLIHLRLGFIAYRLGELAGAKSHLHGPAGGVQLAGAVKTAWAYPVCRLAHCPRRQ